MVCRRRDQSRRGIHRIHLTESENGNLRVSEMPVLDAGRSLSSRSFLVNGATTSFLSSSLSLSIFMSERARAASATDPVCPRIWYK